LIASQVNGVYFIDAVTGEQQAPTILVGKTTGAYGTAFEQWLEGIEDPTNPNSKKLFMITFPSANGGDGSLVFIDEETRSIVNEITGMTNFFSFSSSPRLFSCSPSLPA